MGFYCWGITETIYCRSDNVNICTTFPPSLDGNGGVLGCVGPDTVDTGTHVAVPIPLSCGEFAGFDYDYSNPADPLVEEIVKECKKVCEANLAPGVGPAEIQGVSGDFSWVATRPVCIINGVDMGTWNAGLEGLIYTEAMFECGFDTEMGGAPPPLPADDGNGNAVPCSTNSCAKVDCDGYDAIGRRINMTTNAQARRNTVTMSFADAAALRNSPSSVNCSYGRYYWSDVAQNSKFINTGRDDLYGRLGFINGDRLVAITAQPRHGPADRGAPHY
jgi:hypothetical protein